MAMERCSANWIAFLLPGKRRDLEMEGDWVAWWSAFWLTIVMTEMEVEAAAEDGCC